MTKGIERISEWVMKNVKEDDIRFMAERWDDHMAGAHKFEALYNVQDLYEVVACRDGRLGRGARLGHHRRGEGSRQGAELGR